ncbi:MAG TPA: cell division protein SepF [Acholeplasma sp.]|jgi:FtsZ-interacting cell division protein YlmF|nr:cell division protein SepF [Acholeplasma sp.]
MARKGFKFTEYKDLTGKQKKKSRSLLTSYDRMKYYTVSYGTEAEIFDIANFVLSGRPVLANFNDIPSKEANQMLSFLAGVVYATEGEICQISDTLFLFARKEEYEDGSLYQYIQDTK